MSEATSLSTEPQLLLPFFLYLCHFYPSIYLLHPVSSVFPPHAFMYLGTPIFLRTQCRMCHYDWFNSINESFNTNPMYVGCVHNLCHYDWPMAYATVTASTCVILFLRSVSFVQFWSVSSVFKRKFWEYDLLKLDIWLSNIKSML